MKRLQEAIAAAEADPAGGKVMLSLEYAKALANRLHWLHEQLSALVEARKALKALDRMSRGVDWCDQDEQARRWSAARRALEGGPR